MILLNEVADLQYAITNQMVRYAVGEWPYLHQLILSIIQPRIIKHHSRYISFNF